MQLPKLCRLSTLLGQSLRGPAAPQVPQKSPPLDVAVLMICSKAAKTARKHFRHNTVDLASVRITKVCPQ